MKRYLSYILTAVLTLAFAACEDVPAPYTINTDGGTDGGDTPTAEAVGDGSLTDPYNSIAANAACAKLSQGDTTTDTYYIKGRVVSIKEAYSTTYGNATFYISDDGTTKNQFYVYRAYYLGNKRYTDGDTPIEVGDSVIVCAKLTNYNGTYETAQGSTYLYYLNGKTADGGSDDGGDNTPISGTNLLTNSSFENWTSGKPDAWTSTTSASNATLSQSTDAHTGTYAVLVGGNDSQNKRLASKEYTLKAGTYKLAAFVKGDGQVRLGYVPVTDGKVGSYVYKNGYETVTSASWTEVSYEFTLTEQTTVNLVLMNPKSSTYATASDKLVDDFTLVTADGGLVDGSTTEPDTPSDNTGTGTGDGTLSNPYNSTAANAVASALPSGESTATDVYIKGRIVSIKEEYGTTYGNATFYISDDGTSSNQLYVYRAYYLGNKKYTEGKTQIKVGDEVIICGKLMNYMGNTPETAQGKAYLYSLNGVTE